MARKQDMTWVWIGAAAAGLWLLTRSRSTHGSPASVAPNPLTALTTAITGAIESISGAVRGSGSPVWAAQGPQDYWFNPASNDLRYAPGLTQPAPGYRPASEWEITTYAGLPVL